VVLESLESGMRLGWVRWAGAVAALVVGVALTAAA
jgi:hypothetical protein